MHKIDELIELAKERGFLLEKEILQYFGLENSEKEELTDVFIMIKDMGIEIKSEHG